MYEFNLFSKFQRRPVHFRIIIPFFVIITSFVIISFSVLLFHNAQQFLEFLRNNYRIIVYLKNNVKEDEIKAIEKEISLLSGVRKYRFIPKDIALKELKGKLDEEKTTIEGIVGNPLPDTFEIQISSDKWGVEEIHAIVEKISSLNGIESVENNEVILKKIHALTKTFTIISWFDAGILIFSVLIFLGSILYLLPREEFTKGNVFLFTGRSCMLSMTGAVVSIGIVFLIYIVMNRYVENYLNILIDGFHISFIPWQSCIVIIISSMIIGIAGGLILSGKPKK